MIPVRDVIPSRRAPIVTIALILVAVLVHASGALDGPTGRAWLERSGFSPARAILGLFRHDGWLSLAVVLVFLWIFGENVEDRLGRVRFALLFAGAGLAAAAAHAAVPVLPGSAPGASGAVAGVLGAYLVLFPRSRVLLFVPLPGVADAVEVPVVPMMLVWLLIQLTLSFGAPGLALVINVAGFLAGAGLVLALGGPARKSEYWR